MSFSFSDIEAYGVERWLAELALALSRRLTGQSQSDECFIPKANRKLRPLGISSKIHTFANDLASGRLVAP